MGEGFSVKNALLGIKTTNQVRAKVSNVRARIPCMFDFIYNMTSRCAIWMDIVDCTGYALPSHIHCDRIVVGLSARLRIEMIQPLALRHNITSSSRNAGSVASEPAKSEGYKCQEST